MHIVQSETRRLCPDPFHVAFVSADQQKENRPHAGGAGQQFVDSPSRIKVPAVSLFDKKLLFHGKSIRKEKGKGSEGVFWEKWEFAGLDFTNRRG